jgi:hypothetical protein
MEAIEGRRKVVQLMGRQGNARLALTIVSWENRQEKWEGISMREMDTFF